MCYIMNINEASRTKCPARHLLLLCTNKCCGLLFHANAVLYSLYVPGIQKDPP